MAEIYNFSKVENILKENGVKALSTYIPFKLVENSILILELDDFMSFMTDNQINQVFLYEHWVEADDYKITDDTFKELGVSRYSLEYLLKDIDEYNKMLDDVEFDVPSMVLLMFLWNGQRFYHSLYNEVLLGDNVLLSAEDKLADMIMLNENNIIDANNKRHKEIEKQQKEFKNYLVNDDEFKKCTNQRMRRNFIIEIVKTDIVPKELKSYWMNCNGFLFQSAYDFIEMVWRELKGK